MMNYNRTLQCSKAKEGYRKEAKYPPNRLRRLQTFASLKFARRDAVQPCKKMITREIKPVSVVRGITKQ